jgi:hypothetical protein
MYTTFNPFYQFLGFRAEQPRFGQTASVTLIPATFPATSPASGSIAATRAGYIAIGFFSMT